MDFLNNKAVLGGIACVTVLAALGIFAIGGKENPAPQSTGTAEPPAATAFTADTPAPALEPVQVPQGEALITPRVLGDPNAPVTIIEYSSMTCPHCAAFHTDTLPTIKERYIDTGKVKLELRDYPLNEGAALGSLLARCAPEDRYFPLVDLLFAQQAVWVGGQNLLGELARMAAFAGMSQESITECFQNQDLFSAIVRQRDVWNQIHEIDSTPTFYINGAPVIGNQPLEDFERVIEAELN